MERTIEFEQVGGNMMVEYEELLARTEYDNSETVIPAVGRKVYIVSIDSKCIYEEEVHALGKDTFLLKGFMGYKSGYGEQYYDDYCSTWFLDLDEAKAHLNRYLNDDEMLEGEGWEGQWMTKPL